MSNNGTGDVDYPASIAAHVAVPGTGPFRGGSATASPYADFDQSYDPINGLNYEGAASRYTVSDGDTLESIAQQLWGDASFWYMIAEANGLSGSSAISAGRYDADQPHNPRTILPQRIDAARSARSFVAPGVGTDKGRQTCDMR